MRWLVYLRYSTDLVLQHDVDIRPLSSSIASVDIIAGSAPALYTEVLSPVFSSANNTFTVGDLGAFSLTGTEGDAIQLWIYGFLLQVDPRTGPAVAAGLQKSSRRLMYISDVSWKTYNQ